MPCISDMRSSVSLAQGLGLAIALCCVSASAQTASGRLPRHAKPEDRGVRAAAPDDVLIGRLELVWGDAPPAADGSPSVKHEFRANLVEDSGVRHALHTDRALVAADDLYGLYQRRVAVGLSPLARKSGNGLRSSAASNILVPDELLPDAIVPVEDLVSPGPATRSIKPANKGQVRANAQAIAGVTSWVTLMCKFSDQPTEQKPQSFFQSQYGNAIGQLGHYWQEVSYGQINLAGSNAYGWATLPEPRSYYVTFDTETNKEKADLTKLFQDCTGVHNANVNFAINGGVQGVNMMFNDNLDGFAWGGSRCATLDGINKCWSTTWNPPWSFNNLAPLSHEMGHAYGLPHANNSDSDTDPYDNVWDVMSDAWNNAVSNATYGSLPKHINIYSRNRLGWVTSARKRTVVAGSGANSIVLDRASLAGSANMQMITLAYPDQSTRYFVVEARVRGGDYENRLPGDAVVIHEVDTSRKEPAWSMDADNPPANRSNNEGSMFKVGETWTSPDYAFRVKVESATAQGFVVTIKPTPTRATPTPSQRATNKPGAAALPSTTRTRPLQRSRRVVEPGLRR
jgi:M6 family metalloprotease-like protein